MLQETECHARRCHVPWGLSRFWGTTGKRFRSSSVSLAIFQTFQFVFHPQTAVRLFANDSLIYRSIQFIIDQVLLQRDLDALHLWGQCWGMRFSKKKCNIINLGKKRFQIFYQVNSAFRGCIPCQILGCDIEWRSIMVLTHIIGYCGQGAPVSGLH